MLRTRLNAKCIKLYDKLEQWESDYEPYLLPTYLYDVIRPLSHLDEVLTDFEEHDTAYLRDYAMHYNNWKSLEHAFYKMLKRIAREHGRRLAKMNKNDGKI